MGMDYNLYESAERDKNLYNWSRNKWEHIKHPYFALIFLEAVTLLFIGLGIWGMVVDATKVLEPDGVMFFLGPFFIILWGIANIYALIQIRKYGIYGGLNRPYRVFGTKGVLYNPIREEGALLMKLRDPRVSIRRKCLMKILNSWGTITEFKEIDQKVYVKRLTYCLIEKNPKIRRIACEVLHRHFDEYLPFVAELLRNGLDLNYYLVDKSLRTLLKEEPFQKIRFCGNLECFASNEPCKL